MSTRGINGPVLFLDRDGIVNEDRGYANRGTFLVDRDGTIVFADMVGPGEVRENAVWDKALGVIG